MSGKDEELLPCPHHEDAIYPQRRATCKNPFFTDELKWYEVVYECPECGWSFSEIGCTEDEADEAAMRGWNTRHERTCHDASDPSVSSFICDACLCCMIVRDDHDATLWRDGKPMDAPRYCPNCGAKVVQP